MTIREKFLFLFLFALLMWIVGIAAGWLSGCAVSGVTKHGVTWHMQGIRSVSLTRLRIERAIALSAAAYEAATGRDVTGQMVKHLKSIDFRWTGGDKIECDLGDRKLTPCLGYTSFSLDIVVMERGCLKWKSLAHELMHAFHRQTIGSLDRDHNERHLYYGPRSATWLAYAAMRREGFCHE